MRISRRQSRKILLQAIAGFLFWTTMLTPYMILVVDTDWHQYWRWIGMQILIVPVLAPLSVWFINWFVDRFQRGP